MPHFQSFYDNEWITAFDLGDPPKDRTVKISRVVAGAVTGKAGRKSKKPLIYFHGAKKALAANKTNAKTIASMYGPRTENWIDKPITLYATETEMNGEVVPCIRVRPGAPDPKLVKSHSFEERAPEATPEPAFDDGEVPPEHEGA